MFGRCISNRIRPRRMRRNRTVVDDAPPARRLALHHLDRFLCAQKHTGKVRRDDILPFEAWQNVVATTFCQASNGKSSSGTAGAPIPALLNNTSSRPKVDFTVANSETIDSRLDTSVGTTKACAPATLISPATLSSITLRRPASTRL